MSKKLIVLVADIVGSTKIKNWDVSQKELLEIYHRINGAYKKDFYAPVMITRGDEIAAVFRVPDNLYRIADSILDTIYPLEMRFVFVKGLLTAGLDTRDAGTIDGPAFKTANDSLLRAKTRKQDFVFCLGNRISDDVLTSLASLLSEIKKGWTENQRNVVRLYRELQNQRRVAERLNVSQQNIAKTLKSVNWARVHEAEEALNSLLKKYNQL